MANKRILKKQIKYICGDVALECALALQTIPGIDEKVITEAITDIARLQTETLANASFAFDKAAHDYEDRSEYNKDKSSYYNKAFTKLRVEFNEKLLKIVDKMNTALPKLKD